MTRPPSRLMAVQAVIVGVLTVVVVVTFLRPESEPPLLGVQGPADVRGTELPDPGGYVEPRDPDPGGNRPPAAGPMPSATATAGATVSPPALVGPPAPSATTPAGVEASTAGGGGQGSPANDQYDDTLTRLMARLN